MAAGAAVSGQEPPPVKPPGLVELTVILPARQPVDAKVTVVVP